MEELTKIIDLPGKFGVAEQTIRNEIKAKGIQPHKVGRTLKLDVAQCAILEKSFIERGLIKDTELKEPLPEERAADQRQDELKEKLLELSAKIKVLEAEIERLRAEAETTEKSHAEIVELLKSQISELKQDKITLQRDKEALQTSLNQEQILHLNIQKKLIAVHEPESCEAAEEVPVTPDQTASRSAAADVRIQEIEEPKRKKKWYEIWK